MLHTFTLSLSGTYVLHAFIESADPFLSISWNPPLADNLELMFLTKRHLPSSYPELTLPGGLTCWPCPYLAT